MNSIKRYIRKYAGWIVGAMVGVIVLCLVGYFVAAKSAQQAVDDYTAQQADWDKNQRPKLLAATATFSPRAIYTPGDAAKAYPVTQRECNNVKVQVSTIREAAKKIPHLEAGVLATLSADYRAAKAASNKKVLNLEKYIQKAQKTYEQYHVDCQFFVNINANSEKIDSLYASLESLEQKGGTVFDGIICANANGCLSDNDVKRKKYIGVYNAITEEFTKSIASQKDGVCEKTSIGDNCAALIAKYERSLDARNAYSRYVAKLSTTVDKPKIAELSFEEDQALIKFYQATYDAYRKSYSKYEIVQAVTNKETLKDHKLYFTDWMISVMDGRVKDLKKLQYLLG